MENNLENGMYEAFGEVLGFIAALLYDESVHRDIEYAANRKFPNKLLGSSDAAQALRLGLISSDNFKNDLLDDGLSGERANVLFGLTAKFLGLNDLIDSYRRGFITESEFHSKAHILGYSSNEADLGNRIFNKLFSAGDVIDAFYRKIYPDAQLDKLFDNLKQQGYSQEYIDLLIQTSKKLPNPQELFTINAWSADDDAFARQFKLDEGITQTYLDECFKLGIDDKLARRLWRSHWQPPSVFILRQLFHTGAISKENLKILLKAYQMPPFAIDEVVNAFYQPLTSSEIVDGVKQGLITNDKVSDYVSRLGYNEQDAKVISKLLVAKAVNGSSTDKTAHQEQVAKTKGLSEGNILAGFKQGLIDEQTTRDFLGAIEPKSEFVDYQIQLAKYEMAKQLITDEENFIKDAYLDYEIDQATALSYLNQLPITADRAQHLLHTWTRQLNKTNKKPDKSELGKFLKDGIIDEQIYTSEMSQLGYNATYISWFIAELSKPKNATPTTAAG